MEPIGTARIESFKEFWPFYLGEHSKTATRSLHFVGTSLSTIALIGVVASGHPLYFPLAFVPGYALAWIGHFGIEKNKPATFKYPLWSFMADYKMCALMLSGRMNKEISLIRHLEKQRAE